MEIDLIGHNPKKKKPAGYYTEENTLKELKEIIVQLGHFPTKRELRKIGRRELAKAIKRHHEDINKFRRILGYEDEISLRHKSGYWTDETILTELKSIIAKLGNFPSQSEIAELKRYDLHSIIVLRGGYNKFRKLLGYETISYTSPGYWNDEKITDKLKQIALELGHFPLWMELWVMKKNDLIHAIRTHGGREKFGLDPKSERGRINSYLVTRGRKTEKIVKEIIMEWCKTTGVPPPKYNMKLARGKIIEFVCNVGKKIGIDVTNTETEDTISHKWAKKAYQEHLDELWIVVFSDTFTNSDYTRFNKISPDNVKIMSIEDFMNELEYSAGENLKSKIEKYCECSFHTKDQLKYQNMFVAEEKTEYEKVEDIFA
jgi:hypothetical protein